MGTSKLSGKPDEMLGGGGGAEGGRGATFKYRSSNTPSRFMAK